MSNRYRTIVETPKYIIGKRGGCTSKLQSNGKRFRLIVDGVKKYGDNVSFYRHLFYLSREAGRKLLRRYRLAHIRELEGNNCSDTRIDTLLHHL